MGQQTIKVTVDAIVFGYKPREGISVLLVKRKYPPYQGEWAIPGGFVRDDEPLEQAVARELREETGLETNYLEQLYTFGAPERDPRERIISVAYYGLVRPGKYQLKADSDADDAQWFDIDHLPSLAFDHQKILETAVHRLRAKITYEPVGFELLDEKFPFSDLEELYTTLLGREIDRRNFRKKILSLGVLDELKEKRSLGAGRPATLFRFNKKRYFKLKEKGTMFEV